MSAVTVTDRIYLRDAQRRAFEANVVTVDEAGRVALDATSFLATWDGESHDTGTLAREGGAGRWWMCGVVARWDGTRCRAMGAHVRGARDWERRYGLILDPPLARGRRC